MARIATLLLAVTLSLSSAAAWSLGLGSLTSKSALNQPFQGEIPLLDVDPGELDTVKAQLAGAADFDRVARRDEAHPGQPEIEHRPRRLADVLAELRADEDDDRGQGRGVSCRRHPAPCWRIPRSRAPR